jgi:hypothetical protein
MLTFLSRLVREWVESMRGPGPGRLPAPVPPRLVKAAADRDTAVAGVLVLAGATAFVAGQGARIYSLDAFRNGRGPRRPQAA